MQDKEAKRIAMEKDKISALIQKHRPSTLNLPDKVSLPGTGTDTNSNGTEGPKKVHPPYKKATKPNQIKSSNSKGTKPNTSTPDPLLGDKLKRILRSLKQQNL